MLDNQMKNINNLRQIENIKKLRKSKKMTQEELAKFSGLTVKTISRFENGENISFDSMKKIFIALGYDFLKESDIHLDKVIISFDKQAKYYNEFTLLTNDIYVKRILNIGGPFTNKRVLDLGCGTGILSLKLSPFAKEVHACDISDMMVKDLKERVMEQKNKNIKILKTDAHNMEYPKNYFDTIISVLTFHHFSDIDKVMENIRRVLKQFGELIIVDILTSPNEAESLLHNSCEKIRDFSHTKFFNYKELKTLLKENGFGDFVIERFEVKRNYEDWIKMSNYQDSEKILYNLLKGLALNKIDMGLDLKLENDSIFFTQKMITLKATKLEK